MGTEMGMVWSITATPRAGENKEWVDFPLEHSVRVQVHTYLNVSIIKLILYFWTSELRKITFLFF